jgi:predicted ATP-grasp superfamily ATP-dependent carboligase
MRRATDSENDAQGPRLADRPGLVILGGSCRAAAASAAAAGWAVHAADAFGDLDLEAIAATSRRVIGYPDGLEAAAAGFPPGPWCYTGAIENHPELIDRIAAVRPLAGNSGESLRLVRNPLALARTLAAAGLKYPETFTTPRGLPGDGSFLRKPLATAGGRGISVWRTDPDDDAVAGDVAGFVWQRRVAGTPMAAVYAVGGGRQRLLGLSRQLVGEPACRAGEFAYCGSVQTPAHEVREDLLEQLTRLGETLAMACGMAGVVAADLMLDVAFGVTVIEVNPRPSGSMELVERTTGESILATHLAAFGWPSPRPPQGVRSGSDVWSKAVLFTPAELHFDDRMLDGILALKADWTAADCWPAIADIPRPGERLRAGGPLLTIFARGDAPQASRAELDRRIAAVKMLTG